MQSSPWWRLSFGTLAFVALAFYTVGLLPLALAALLLTAGPSSWWELSLILLLVALGLFILITPIRDPLHAALGTYTVIVAVAFAGVSLAAPGSLLRQGIRAALWGVAGTGGLGLVLRGNGFWSELQWSLVRDLTANISQVVQWIPRAAAISGPFVHVVADAFPALLLLSTLLALLLAWQWHVRISRRPLGAPLGAFREFRFGDHWVWALVLALIVWTVPKLAGLTWAAANVGIVLGALYVVRGTAVVVAITSTLGVPAWILTIGAIVAGALSIPLFVLVPATLIVPLFVLVPGLWTLGVFDTWLAFRQRRFSRSPAP